MSILFRLAVPFLLAPLLGCGQSEPARQATADDKLLARIDVNNPSAFLRQDELLNLSLASLGADAAMPLSAWRGESELPSQLVDSDADGWPDSLAVLVHMQPAERFAIDVRASASAAAQPSRTQAEVSRKQGGSWRDRKYEGGEFVNVQRLIAPPQHTDHSEYIRYEGPGIESDQVGYRVYLDWRNGFDVFGKRVREPILQQVGQDGFESYHHLAEWGMDVLKVGKSLGMGGFGYWDGNKVIPVSEVGRHQVTIINNGPLVSSFAIDYEQWQVAGRSVDLRAHFTMTAGSPLVHVQLHSSEALTPMVAGLVKADGVSLIHGNDDITGHAYTYVGSWGQQSLAGDNLGLALLFKQGERTQQLEDEHSWLTLLTAPSGKLDYYFFANWQGGVDGLGSAAEFDQQMQLWSDRLTFKPRLRIDSKLSQSLRSNKPDAAKVLALAGRMAETELRTKAWPLHYGGWDPERDRPVQWEYTTGLLSQAFDDLAAAGGGDHFAGVAAELIGSYVTPEGELLSYKLDSYNIDNINAGKMLLRLFQQTGEQRFQKAAEKLRTQLESHPKTSNGGFWHKKKYPGQVWLDGVYMGMPFLAEYSLLFEQGESLADAVHEFDVVNEKLRSESGLIYHAWDELRAQNWADKQTGLSPEFWSRGMGWYAMALVDMLTLLPDTAVDERARLTGYLRDFVGALVRYQNESGVWYQITDKPEAVGNYPEASATAMFVYAMAKGINLGALPDSYRDQVVKSYQGMVREFVSLDPDGDVHFNNNCQVAGLGYGRDGSYRYYMSEPLTSDDLKGLAPFIMASVQVSKLLAK